MQNLICKFNKLEAIKRCGFETIFIMFLFFLFTTCLMIALAATMSKYIVVMLLIPLLAIFVNVAMLVFITSRVKAMMYYSEYFKNVEVYDDYLELDGCKYSWRSVVEIENVDASAKWQREKIEIESKRSVNVLFGGILKIKDYVLLDKWDRFWLKYFVIKLKMKNGNYDKIFLPNKFEMKSYFCGGVIFDTSLVKNLKEIHFKYVAVTDEREKR